MMLTSRARNEEVRRTTTLGGPPWLEGKARGKTVIQQKSDLKKLEPSAKETSCCDDDYD
jgi:hypothetical protein